MSGEYSSLMVVGGNDYALTADHLVGIPTRMDRFYILDHEIPFYQIVTHGYADYSGEPVNTWEVQDTRQALLNMLATGAAPRYLWSYNPTRNLEFSPYEFFYSTHYINWFDAAVEHYTIYNEIFNKLRTLPITGHEILSEASSFVGTVTVTEYGGQTLVYVNATNQPYFGDGFMVPAMGYYVREAVR
jgi:hypothetical protein